MPLAVSNGLPLCLPSLKLHRLADSQQHFHIYTLIMLLYSLYAGVWANGKFRCVGRALKMLVAHLMLFLVHSRFEKRPTVPSRSCPLCHRRAIGSASWCRRCAWSRWRWGAAPQRSPESCCLGCELEWSKKKQESQNCVKTCLLKSTDRKLRGTQITPFDCQAMTGNYGNGKMSRSRAAAEAGSASPRCHLSCKTNESLDRNRAKPARWYRFK